MKRSAKLLLPIARIGMLIERKYQSACTYLERKDDTRYINNHVSKTVQLGTAKLLGESSIGPQVQLFGDIVIDKYSTLGHGVIIHGGSVSIGRYCQIGPYAAVYAMNHGLNYITTYNNSRLFSGQLKRLSEVNPVTIGHDVWIGHGAIILPGVHIGNGAVVGAGAIVTTDICNYGIAVGNPARVIRKRFSEETISLLSAWNWWDHSPEELVEYEYVFKTDLNADPDASKRLLQKIIDEKQN